jgi:hypothetical protein
MPQSRPDDILIDRRIETLECVSTLLKVFSASLLHPLQQPDSHTRSGCTVSSTTVDAPDNVELTGWCRAIGRTPWSAARRST